MAVKPPDNFIMSGYMLIGIISAWINGYDFTPEKLKEFGKHGDVLYSTAKLYASGDGPENHLEDENGKRKQDNRACPQ